MKYRSFNLFILLLIICFMAFNIPAAADENSEKTSIEQQKEKIEQFPLSYGLYLPGDEDVYKVKINPITPAEGINTGAPGGISRGTSDGEYYAGKHVP